MTGQPGVLFSVGPPGRSSMSPTIGVIPVVPKRKWRLEMERKWQEGESPHCSLVVDLIYLFFFILFVCSSLLNWSNLSSFDLMTPNLHVDQCIVSSCWMGFTSTLAVFGYILHVVWRCVFFLKGGHSTQHLNTRRMPHEFGTDHFLRSSCHLTPCQRSVVPQTQVSGSQVRVEQHQLTSTFARLNSRFVGSRWYCNTFMTSNANDL